MGLDTSHGAFHGSYSYFMRFRETLMSAIGGPPLRTMVGYDDRDPRPHVSWDPYIDHDLYPLLNHSDSGGILTPSESSRVARGLKKLLDENKLPVEFRETATQFMEGCQEAAMNEEELEFS